MRCQHVNMHTDVGQQDMAAHEWHREEPPLGIPTPHQNLVEAGFPSEVCVYRKYQKKG